MCQRADDRMDSTNTFSMLKHVQTCGNMLKLNLFELSQHDPAASKWRMVSSTLPSRGLSSHAFCAGKEFRSCVGLRRWGAEKRLQHDVMSRETRKVHMVNMFYILFSIQISILFYQPSTEKATCSFRATGRENCFRGEDLGSTTSAH